MLPPSIFLDFADATFLDPRLNFTRASVGSYADRLGMLRYQPAGSPRFWYRSSDGAPMGLLLEAAATNLLLWSEDFTNAAWVPTACSVATNTVVAPDGNPITGDTVTATGPTAALTQSATFTVNNSLAYSVFAKAGVNNFVSITLNDGANVVGAWFNLAAGTVGGTLTGAGTLTYQAASIQAWGGGWYRCGVQARTNSIASVAASLSPCAADRTPPANGNAVYIWGAMLSQEGTNANNQRQSSYIGTAGATATRAADNCPLPYARIEAQQFNPNEGTFFLDWMVPVGTWQLFYSQWLGSALNVAGDYIQTGFTIGYGGVGKLTLVAQSNMAASSVNRGQATDNIPLAFETPIKVACRYNRAAPLGLSLNGRAVVSAAAAPSAMPVLPTNFTFNPFAVWAVANAMSSIVVRRFAYYPRYLSADQMQQITA